jgi:hypothetical protein
LKIPFRFLLLPCALILLTGIFFSTQAQRVCPQAPPSPFRHNARIATRFDRAAGGMRTVLEHPRALSSNGRGAFYLAASFMHSGWSAAPPVELTFISVSNTAHHSQSYALTFFINNNPTRFPPPQYTTARRDGDTYEAVRTTLTYENLLEITNARNVRVRVGASEITLSENHLESLRELASLMRPRSRSTATTSDPFSNAGSRRGGR